ncbi:exodeoxyribonuclease VII large subunit [Verrucomicrobium sp. BvORR106]|uniref:exodeoxyribonuclease VII large subunit n=1 Tax=Verrucomicrobium sp. BvORR106 TaxID=1403819 RepID=UPI00056F7CA5|nr:exodeoxyribonuclease VII large subunit [Verrucomicrobium sp. BvORR106]
MSSVLSVSQLTRQIRSLLEGQIGDVSVEGEISNHRLQSSGHQYFTLKDEGAQISCVLFRGASARMQTPLRDGMQVQLFGELTVYEQRGNYQIIVRSVQPKGQGSLQARFEALKQKLAAEGLFENHWKKPIPKFPRVVALVTSPTGAAIRDMLNILTRRAPWLRVLVFPVRVQGQGAEQEIARAIDLLNQEVAGLPRPDTIVVGRGGGSLEDLWNFNEEVVARSIFASTIPVISAVGHEIDFTIADFVADMRAPTPSAAAELLAPDTAELQRHFDAMEKSMTHRMRATLEHHERVLELTGKGALRREPERLLRDAVQSVDDVESTYHRAQELYWRSLDDRMVQHHRSLEKYHPQRVLTEAAHRVALLQQHLGASMRQRIEQRAQKVLAMRKLLKSMGPDSVLSRGFSMTTDATGKVIEDASKLRTGDMMITRLAKGKVASVVTTNK